jgi:hypothetical protein
LAGQADGKGVPLIYEIPPTRRKNKHLRAGFKRAWQERDYATIISLAEKIPDRVLQEDQKLLMWYDQAVTRSGDV